MRAGRTHWRIENETFNTLKNQGYGFEHNFGHGRTHLSVVLANLMMLAFPLDQVQARCCSLFHQARHKAGRSRYFWERVGGLFLYFVVSDCETLYKSLPRTPYQVRGRL